MPELPEIENACRRLAPTFSHLTIKSVTRRSTLALSRGALAGLRGLRLVAWGRHGKLLTVKLSDETRLIFHFGMSGRLVARAPTLKHDHFALRFANGLWLTYNDFRRFGRLWRVAETDLQMAPPIKGLGPDALSRDFRASTLRLESRRSIKSTLLDQSVVSGIGNIYSCEILYRAGIAPTRMTNSLSNDERVRLVDAVKHTLLAAIRRGGSTLDDFRGTEGEAGDFDRIFAVFGKAGFPCPKCRCRGGVQRIRQEGRSTYFCPTRQD